MNMRIPALAAALTLARRNGRRADVDADGVARAVRRDELDDADRARTDDQAQHAKRVRRNGTPT